MNHISMPRRTFLTTAAAVTGTGLGSQSASAADSADAFTFAVVRSDTEWRAQLTDLEFTVLRGGGTEKPKSSPLWQETRDGVYCCKACDLKLYESYWKTVLDMGWVFFRHSAPFSIVTAIDK